MLQEWAAHNGVPVPHKEGRMNNSLLYKGGEEDTPTNILQVCSPLRRHSGQLVEESLPSEPAARHWGSEEHGLKSSVVCAGS